MDHMPLRFCSVSIIFVSIFTTWLVQSDVNVTWARDPHLDNVVIINGLSRAEVPGASVRQCACLCTSNSSCSSFFFLPATGKCLLYEFVFANLLGSQPSAGARYFRATSAACPARDGYVWLRRQRMCIKFYLSTTTFHYAYGNCTSVGARVVVLDTGDKHRAVVAYLADTASPTPMPFIGATREGVLTDNRSTWDNTLHPLYWLNGVQVALSGPDSIWYVGNPDNAGGSEGCMEIWDGKWNDVQCDASKPFICEKVLG